jgi:uncharacterized protein (DUF433 family)
MLSLRASLPWVHKANMSTIISIDLGDALFSRGRGAAAGETVMGVRCVHGRAPPRALREARSVIVTDPEILGGDPVFRGTRVPVHLIAAMLDQGSTVADILKAYPRVTAEMIHLAAVYAGGYPSRNGRRTQPWRDRPPLSRTRKRLA